MLAHMPICFVSRLTPSFVDVAFWAQSFVSNRISHFFLFEKNLLEKILLFWIFDAILLSAICGVCLEAHAPSFHFRCAPWFFVFPHVTFSHAEFIIVAIWVFVIVVVDVVIVVCLVIVVIDFVVIVVAPLDELLFDSYFIDFVSISNGLFLYCLSCWSLARLSFLASSK